MSPTTPTAQRVQALTYGSVWAVPVSLAATQGIAFAFSSWGYLDVSVHPVRFRISMCSISRVQSITSARLPHSEIPGSTVVCTFPELIAAYHVLHRLQTPRHPPYALSSLTKKNQKFAQLKSVLTLIKEPEDACFLIPYAVVKERFAKLPGLKTGEVSQLMVEITGIEPVTSGLQSRRSPN